MLGVQREGGAARNRTAPPDFPREVHSSDRPMNTTQCRASTPETQHVAYSFQQLWALGYRNLVPVIPPTAEISEGSSLFGRLGTRQDARGKIPGVRGRDGKWFSWDWVPHEADETDLQRWADMGAGVGIKTGSGLYAIDADTLDESSAIIARDIIRDICGASPVRVGRFPKALYPVRLTEDIPYARVDFGTPDAAGNLERVEILGARKFFVASGTHPKTKAPYSWPRDLVPFDELPLLDPADISEILNRLREALPHAKPIATEGDGGDANQDALKGDPQSVRRAVQATPNTSAHFPTRESYRDMGYAIKASIPDDEPEAFEIFSEWCDRWAEGDNDPDIIAADWRRMKPPFRRGASWLYEQAARIGHDFNPASVYFDPVQTTAPSPFEVQAEKEREEEQATDFYPLLTADAIIARPPPTFLIDRFIPDVSLGFLYSAPGVGKSFVAMDMALSIAHGFDTWHGDPITAAEDKREIVYIAGEGSFDLRNRLLAWAKARGVSSLSKNFRVIETAIDFMQASDIDRLLRTVRSASLNPAMVFVDTVSRAMPGADENLQKDMTLFVRACDHVKMALKCAVMGIHHAGKSGDIRGSTVITGAGDYVLRMERKKGASLALLSMDKQKGAPDGWYENIVMEKIHLDDGQSSLVVSKLNDVGGAAGAGGGGSDGMTAIKADLVLRAMAKAWDEGEPWSKAHQAKERYAVRRMAADFGVEASEAESVLLAWEAAGVIRSATRDGKRRRDGFEVVHWVRESPSGETVEAVSDITSEAFG